MDDDDALAEEEVGALSVDGGEEALDGTATVSVFGFVSGWGVFFLRAMVCGRSERRNWE